LGRQELTKHQGTDKKHKALEMLDATKSYEKRWILAAATGGDKAVEVMQEVLAAHPDVVHVKDSACGYTALHWAARRGDGPMLKAVYTENCDLNARSNGGYTPLHLASLHGSHEIQALLREKGADKSLVSYAGYTRNSLQQSWMAAMGAMGDGEDEVKLFDDIDEAHGALIFWLGTSTRGLLLGFTMLLGLKPAPHVCSNSMPPGRPCSYHITLHCVATLKASV
jgi:hypothetical protein